MKTIIITDRCDEVFFSKDAEYFIEEAKEYGYEIGKEFDYSIRELDNNEIEVTIYEDDVEIQVNQSWIEFSDGYVLNDYIIRTGSIKQLIFNF